MKNKELLDIYSDYLISAFGQTTGTRLAGLLGNSVSHDRIQRLLAQERLGAAELWQVVKPYVRQIEQAKRAGAWVRLDQVTLDANTPLEIYLESVDFPLLLVKQVFANEDGSTGIQYLVSSDT